MGILIFVLKYMYISLLLKMINGFSWPTKIMVSPFKSIAGYIHLYACMVAIKQSCLDMNLFSSGSIYI